MESWRPFLSEQSLVAVGWPYLRFAGRQKVGSVGFAGGLRLRLCLVLGVSCKVDCCCCPLLGVVFVPGDVRPNDDAVPRTPPDMLSGASPAFPTCLLGYVSLFGQALPHASGLAVLTSKERRFVYCLPVLHAFRLPLRSSHKRFARAAAPG